MRARLVRRSIIPGFGLTLGFTLAWLCLLVPMPLSSVFILSAGMGWDAFVDVVFSNCAMVNAFVYEFVGKSNRVPVTIADGAQRIDLDVSDRALGNYWMFFRPNEARIIDGDAPGLTAVVTGARPRNGRERVEAKVEGWMRRST